MQSIIPLYCRVGRSPLFWAGAALLLLTGVYQGYCHWINDLPTIVIPRRVRPNPNAYDYFVRAGKISNEIDVNSDAEREAMVAANEPALSTVRQGLPFAFQKYAATDSSAPEFPQAKFRSLARLFAAEQNVFRLRGDYSKSVSSGLDGLDYAVRLAQGGSTVDGLVSAACESIVRRRLWTEFDHLKLAEGRSAARRLEQIDAERTPFADSIETEKWEGVRTLLGLLRKDNIANVVRDLRSESDGTMVPDGRLHDQASDNRQLFTLSKRQVLANYMATMDANRAAASRPYAASKPLVDLQADPISRSMFFFSPQTLYFGYTVNQLHDRLLMTAVALRAYRLEKGSYPDSLSELVTAGILQHNPEDPFAPSAGIPFRYRKLIGDKYLLYSVGPDGVDNDGAPIDVKHAQTFREQTPLATDTGDWVVGVNTPTASADPTTSGFQRW